MGLKLLCSVFILWSVTRVESNVLENDCFGYLLKCDNGRCMPTNWICDSEDDCGDNSDEKNCHGYPIGNCGPDEFTCHWYNQCIPKQLRCDGILNCVDKSDETSCADPQFRCDYTYYRNASTFLKFHYIPGTWHEARRRCSYEGSSLVSPGSLLNVSFLASMAQRNQKKEIFIGISSLTTNGNYYNYPATEKFYLDLPWAKGEPNNVDGNENCLVLRSDGTVADERCDVRRSFICYRNYKQEILNECGTFDNGYQLYRETNKCYKFHTDPKPWSNANEVCLAEGGSLTVINNVNESHVIKKIYAANSTRIGHTAEPDIEDMAFIGFRYDNDTESYETVERNTLTESGYDQFHPVYDSCPLPEYLCGGFHKDGYLDLGDCNRRLMFICEKYPRYDTCSSAN